MSVAIADAILTGISKLYPEGTLANTTRLPFYIKKSHFLDQEADFPPSQDRSRAALQVRMLFKLMQPKTALPLWGHDSVPQRGAHPAWGHNGWAAVLP